MFRHSPYKKTPGGSTHNINYSKEDNYLYNFELFITKAMRFLLIISALAETDKIFQIKTVYIRK